MKYILLASASEDVGATRAFQDFDSREELASTVISSFEDELRLKAQSKFPELPEEEQELEYSSEDLFSYMNSSFAEMVCLAKQDDDLDLWIPYSTAWIKEEIYLYLRAAQEEQVLLQKQFAESISIFNTATVLDNSDVIEIDQNGEDNDDVELIY